MLYGGGTSGTFVSSKQYPKPNDLEYQTDNVNANVQTRQSGAQYWGKKFFLEGYYGNRLQMTKNHNQDEGELQ